jgi:putative flippase GtrA
MPFTIEGKNLRQPIKFGIVGGMGFVVDAFVLFMLINFLYLNPYLSRLISFVFAASFTWFLHSKYTFSVKTVNLSHQWIKFIIFNGSGMILNFLIYSAIIYFATNPFNNPMFSLFISSIVAYAYNFNVSRRYVFKK